MTDERFILDGIETAYVSQVTVVDGEAITTIHCPCGFFRHRGIHGWKDSLRFHYQECSAARIPGLERDTEPSE